MENYKKKYQLKTFSKSFIKALAEKWIIEVSGDKATIRFNTNINMTSVSLTYDYEGNLEITTSSHGVSLEFSAFESNIEMYQMALDFGKDAKLIDFYEKKYEEFNE